MKKEIENLIKQALLSLGIDTESVLVEYPGDMTHGDFATNVAMLYAKGRAQNPKDFALELVSVMKSLPLPEGETKRGWEQISVAGPGFINFKISKEYFYAFHLETHLSGGQYIFVQKVPDFHKVQ
jgi:arginyl-tRNA synthetase